MEIVLIFLAVAIIFMAMMNALNIFDSIVIVDIFLRIMNFIFAFVSGNEVIDKIDEFMPDSLLEPIEMWTSGKINTMLIGIYVLCYAAFLFTLIKRFVKRK